jgi:hypothetical protein
LGGYVTVFYVVAATVDARVLVGIVDTVPVMEEVLPTTVGVVTGGYVTLLLTSIEIKLTLLMVTLTAVELLYYEPVIEG